MWRLNTIKPTLSYKNTSGLRPVNLKNVDRLKKIAESEYQADQIRMSPFNVTSKKQQNDSTKENLILDHPELTSTMNSMETLPSESEIMYYQNEQFTSEPKYTLMQASKLNLTDNNINRAGVVLIYKGYIGLSITSYSSSVATFGGTFEKMDKNLLYTAVREYNEEIGTNLPPITPEILYSGKGIQSDYAVLFFYQIDNIPDFFTKTYETYNIIWITPEQLSIFANKQEYQIRTNIRTKTQGNVARTFVFSYDLKAYAYDIAYYVHTVKNFRVYTYIEPPVNIPVKYKRTPRKQYTEKIYGITEYLYDIENLHYWRGSFIVIDESGIGVYHEEYKILYVIYPDQFAIFKKSLLKNNLLFYSSGGNIYVLNTLTEVPGKVNRKIRNIHEEVYKISLCKTDLNKLNEIKKKPFETRLIVEIKLLEKIESQIYECKKANGYAFNAKRANFLSAISEANIMIMNGSNKEQILDKLSKKYKQTDPNINEILFNIRDLKLIKL